MPTLLPVASEARRWCSQQATPTPTPAATLTGVDRANQSLHWIMFTNVFPLLTWKLDPRRLASLLQHPVDQVAHLLPPEASLVKAHPMVQEGSMLLQYAVQHQQQPSLSPAASTTPLLAHLRAHDISMPAPPVAAQEAVDVASPGAVLKAVEQNLKALYQSSRPWRLMSYISGTIQAHRVWGAPFPTDIALDRPSSRVEVHVEGPDVPEEDLYAALRQYGRLYSVTVTTPAPKADTRRLVATAGFTSTRSSVAARHGLHRAQLGASKLYIRMLPTLSVQHVASKNQQPPICLSNSFAPALPQQTRKFFEFVSKNPQVAVVIAISVTTTISVFLTQPLRTATVEEHLTRRWQSAAQRLVRSLPWRAPWQRSSSTACGAHDDRAHGSQWRVVQWWNSTTSALAWATKASAAGGAGAVTSDAWLGRWHNAQAALASPDHAQPVCLVGPQLSGDPTPIIEAIVRPDDVISSHGLEQKGGASEEGGRTAQSAEAPDQGPSRPDTATMTAQPHAGTVVYLDVASIAPQIGHADAGAMVSALAGALGQWPKPLQLGGVIKQAAELLLPKQVSGAWVASDPEEDVEQVLDTATKALERAARRNGGARPVSYSDKDGSAGQYAGRVS